MKRLNSGGGWPAVRYCLRVARQAGGMLKMWKALRSKNACKTCALGMGGQQGGMVNEAGRFPEVCKKSLQAMAADMQPGIPSSFWSEHLIADLQRMSPRDLEHSGRLTEPVMYLAGESHYRPISWDTAFDQIVSQLNELTPDETFWYFSGRSSNEAGFLLQLMARMFGSNHVNNCSYYCHQASGVGLSSVLGTGTATVVLEDLDQSDLVFVIGGNPPSNHPRLMTSLMHLRRRGGEVVVINPVIETGLVRFKVPSDVRSMLFGSEIANQYVQPHIGGDLALLAGIAKQVDQLGAADDDFLENHCDGASEWREWLRSLSWEEITEKSGVEKQAIVEIAERYARAKHVIFCWTMGVTHHAHGVQNVQAIASLALMRAMVGKPGAGLLPIRGHSNVQGIGSVGVTPKLKQAIFDRLQSEYAVKLPTTQGLDTLGCMESALRGDLKFGLCLGGNLYGSNPDAEFAERALNQLQQLVYLSTTLNTGHARGLAASTMILPVMARDEEPHRTTQESMFNFVRLSEGGRPRHVGPKSEIHVISQLADRILGESDVINWKALRDPAGIRQMIAKVVPGFEAMEEIDRTSKEFQIGGRTFHSPQFATETQRAQLHVHQLPPLKGGAGCWRLMTVRSEGQFNTVVYDEEDIYRGQDRRDGILLHPHDLQQCGWHSDQLVRVRSDVGEISPIRARAFDAIRPGNALMYFPEANVLVPRTPDAQSRTPAFKGVVVEIEAVESSNHREAESTEA